MGPSARYINTESYFGGFSKDDSDGLLNSLDANYLGWSSAMSPVIMANADRLELGKELDDSFCRVEPAIASQCAPVEVGTFVNEHIPNRTMVLLNSTGHVPHLSDPDEVVRQIRAFAG